jgi:DnaJ-class molecular chaperone
MTEKLVLKRTCSRCHGSGKDPDNPKHRCYACRGKGVVYIRR